MAQRRIASPPAIDDSNHRLLRRVGMSLAGVVVLLALAGQVIVAEKAVSSGALLTTGSSVQVPATGTLRHRLNALLNEALGPSDRGAKRFAIVRVSRDPIRPHRREVLLTWAVNNDLSAGTLGNAAQADAYVILRDVYTSGLPISTVRLTATYPLTGTLKQHRESTVMRLVMSARNAATIATVGWDNFDAQTLWPLIQRSYVNPQFQPLAPE